MSDRKTTILDVAEKAGVSAGTVSRVINHHPAISKATVQRVGEAMAAVGYIPPHPTRRRGPKTKGRSGIFAGQIAVVPLGFSVSLMYAPVMLETLKGVHAALDDHELSLIIAPINDLRRLPSVLTRTKVDGVILEGAPPSAAVRKAFKGIPKVFLYSAYGTAARGAELFDHVLADNQRVGEIAAGYLLSSGIRRVAYMDCEPLHPAHVERRLAFASAVKCAGVSLSTFVVSQTSPELSLAADVERIRECAIPLVRQFAESKDLPEGVFIPGDLMTAVFYEEFRKVGFKPGKDFLVVSCNNEKSLLAGLNPSPATIDTRAELIGRRAVEHLLCKIKNQQEASGMRITVAPELILPF